MILQTILKAKNAENGERGRYNGLKDIMITSIVGYSDSKSQLAAWEQNDYVIHNKITITKSSSNNALRSPW